MKPAKVYHLSANRRRDGCTGGVEKFGWLLEQAIGCDLIVDRELSGVLSKKDGNALFVVDGGHGLSIPDDTPILSVCHGSWVGLWARWGFTKEMEGHEGAPYEESQVKMWGTYSNSGKHNVLPVACSGGAKRELVQYHNRLDAPVILHGVHHNVYIPKKTFNPKPIIIHVANEWRKGHHIIPEVAKRLPQFQFEFLSAGIGQEPERFARGDMFIHISCSEGNAYACLEAMSCDLPMVVTNVGLFESDVPSATVGKVVEFYSSVDNIVEAVLEVWENKERFHPREWIEQNATFEHFKQRWVELIEDAEDYGLIMGG